MKRITIKDYKTDSSAHNLANNLMRQYGYDANDVDEIEIDGDEIRFRTVNKSLAKEWHTHPRNGNPS